MHTIGTFTSDTVNRLGQRFGVEALESFLDQKFMRGIPSTLEHDAHMLVGWSYPTGLHFEAGIRRVLGVSFIPDTDEERKELKKEYAAYKSWFVRSHTADTADDLATLLTKQLNGDEILMYQSCTAFYSKGILKRVCPKLVASADKDGLVDIPNLDYLGNGCFRHGDLVLFAHPFLRRSLSRANNVNGDFMDAFITAGQKAGITKHRIALDPDMIGLNRDLVTPIEHAYWRGPMFDSDLKSMPLGLAIQKASDVQRVTLHIDRTEFNWSSRDGKHIFEAEELRELPMPPDGNDYGCRYVHSTVIEESGVIDHLDGAIRSYTEEQYINERIPVDMVKAGRKSIYKKIWRIDGKLPFSDWKALICSWFKQNDLVPEYFGGKKNDDEFVNGGIEDNVKTIDPLLKYVPFAIAKEAKVNIILGYQPIPQILGSERRLHPIRFWSRSGDDSVPCLTSQTVDLLKLFKSKNLTVDFDPNALYDSYDDFYFEFPLLEHLGPQSYSDTQTSVSVIRECIELAREPQRIFSFSLSWLSHDRVVLVSVLGSGDAIIDWLSADLFPRSDLEDMPDWCQRTCKYLDSDLPADKFQEYRESSVLHDIFGMTATFKIDRRKAIVKVHEGGAALVLTEHDTDLRQLLSEKRLTPIRGHLMKGLLCSCGKSYLDCEHIRFRDSNIAVSPITPFDLALYWSDRPAGSRLI